MATKRNPRRSGSGGIGLLGKPNGVIQPRVQAAGPELRLAEPVAWAAPQAARWAEAAAGLEPAPAQRRPRSARCAGAP